MPGNSWRPEDLIRAMGGMPSRQGSDPMQEFSRSVRGTHFFDAQLPQLIRALERNAAALEKYNALQESASVPVPETSVTKNPDCPNCKLGVMKHMGGTRWDCEDCHKTFYLNLK